MTLNEIIKNFLKTNEPVQPEKTSSVVKTDNVLVDLGREEISAMSFFDQEALNYTGFSDRSKEFEILEKQNEKILKYRQLAMNSDVADALDDIINEIIFSFDDKDVIKVNINEDNEKLVKAITDKFEKVKNLLNITKNAYEIVKNAYIDGQLVFHCPYDPKKVKGGIQRITMLDPVNFHYDKQEKVYRYVENKLSFKQSEPALKYSLEEIVKEDFGIKQDQVNLGYLEYAIKPANMLKNLEDLLIPLRFSRSISRRVFNVDIGDLPNKRGAEVMREHQAKFKYKKFFNNETGEVSNQQHITSMVEDYWFANRSGGKGTTVDVLDESGNLGELGDIIYFAEKLYRSLKIPPSRIVLNKDRDNEFDYETTRVTKEDLKFFMFISRVRRVFTSAFKRLLKREVISSGIMTEDEWNEKDSFIDVTFTNENSFIEKMKIDTFMRKLDIYATANEYQGKLFSVNTILKDIFRMSDEEIEEEFKKIQKEEKDPLYAKFYKEDEDGF